MQTNYYYYYYNFTKTHRMHIAYHVLTELNVLDPKFDVPLKQKEKKLFEQGARIYVHVQCSIFLKMKNKIK